jgi:hypothetical protein
MVAVGASHVDVHDPVNIPCPLEMDVRLGKPSQHIRLNPRLHETGKMQGGVMASSTKVCPLRLSSFPPSVAQSLKTELAVFIESTSKRGKLHVAPEDSFSYVVSWYEKYYVENQQGVFFTLDHIISSREGGKLDTLKLVCCWKWICYSFQNE